MIGNRRKRYWLSVFSAVIFLLIAVMVWYFCIPQFLYPALRGNAVKNADFLEGTFELRVNLPLNRKTQVRYMIPVDTHGKPLSSASHMVFYAPFNGDAPRLRRDLPEWIRKIPAEYGFSVFSLTIEADTQSVTDHAKYYIYRECGWYELIFRIKAHLEKEFSLHPEKLLITGESSGGSMAQQMAAAYPQKIAAAAWCGGSRYVRFRQRISVPMLALHNWGCYGLDSTAELLRNAEEYRIPFQTMQTPSFLRRGSFEHHAGGDTAYRLMCAFLADAVNGTSQFQKLAALLPNQAVSRIDRKYPDWINFPPDQKPVRNIIYSADSRMSPVHYKDFCYYAALQGNAVFLHRSASAGQNTISVLKNQLSPVPVLFIGETPAASVQMLIQLFNQSENRIQKVVLFNPALDTVLPDGIITLAKRFPNTEFHLYYAQRPVLAQEIQNLKIHSYSIENTMTILLHEIM